MMLRTAKESNKESSTSDFSDTNDNDARSPQKHPYEEPQATGPWKNRTAIELFVEASKPTTLFQKAIEKYWEEFEKEPSVSSPSKQQRRQSTSTSLLPPVASLLQLLQLLFEFHNDPAVDGQLTVLEAWRESQTFRNETDKISGSNEEATGDNNATKETTHAADRTSLNVNTWMTTWKEGLTNEDIRDVGDHIWRYLIGGAYISATRRYSLNHIPHGATSGCSFHRRLVQGPAEQSLSVTDTSCLHCRLDMGLSREPLDILDPGGRAGVDRTGTPNHNTSITGSHSVASHDTTSRLSTAVV
jgi:hypothetical protein